MLLGLLLARLVQWLGQSRTHASRWVRRVPGHGIPAGCKWQVSSSWALGVARRCNGRTHSSVSSHSCGHACHGWRRPSLSYGCPMPDLACVRWQRHLPLRWLTRTSSTRRQARHRLFHMQPTRVHDDRAWTRAFGVGDGTPCHSCDVQSHPLPLRWDGDRQRAFQPRPSPVWRTRHFARSTVLGIPLPGRHAEYFTKDAIIEVSSATCHFGADFATDFCLAGTVFCFALGWDGIVLALRWLAGHVEWVRGHALAWNALPEA